MILQDRDVTYREIQTTLGISGTSIHSILHEHLTVKKNLFALDPTITQKRLVSIGQMKCSKNTIAVFRKPFMTSRQVMNRGIMRMSPKVNSSRL